jgi:hypothetical protein
MNAMSTQSGPTRAVFESVLTPEYLQITRILQAALVSGPTLFAAGLLAFFFFTVQPPTPALQAVQTMDRLSVAHVGFTIVAYLLAPLLFSRVMTGTRLDPGGDSTTPDELARQALLLLRTAIIVRLAVLEGAAFFGIAVCVLGVSGGVLYTNSTHWLNLGSTLLLVLFGFLTFPTRDGLLDILESSFGR